MAVSISDLLAKDAAFYVRRWAREMQVTEGEIMTRLVRQEVLVLRVKRSHAALEDARVVLDVKIKVPFGQLSTIILAAINSRPGLWTVPEIRACIRDTTDYYVKPKVLTGTLSDLRRSGAIVGHARGLVSRAER